MSKESFLLYKPFYEPIKNLSREDKGELLEFLFEYQINNKEPDTSSPIYPYFLFFKNQFRLDEEKYQAIANRNQLNGAKGGRPPITQNNPDNPVGSFKPKKAVTVTDTVTVTEKEKEDKKMVNWQAIYKEAAEVWNEYAGFSVFPKIQKMNEQRKKLFKARYNDELNKDMNTWIDFCCSISDYPFLLGKNDSGWVANIDWALRPNSITKTLEGGFNNNKNGV